MDYVQLAEQHIGRAQAATIGHETGAFVNALTAIAYGLLRIAEAIDGHE